MSDSHAIADDLRLDASQYRSLCAMLDSGRLVIPGAARAGAAKGDAHRGLAPGTPDDLWHVYDDDRRHKPFTMVEWEKWLGDTHRFDIHNSRLVATLVELLAPPAASTPSADAARVVAAADALFREQPREDGSLMLSEPGALVALKTAVRDYRETRTRAAQPTPPTRDDSRELLRMAEEWLWLPHTDKNVEERAALAIRIKAALAPPDGARDARGRPEVVCLCGSTRFVDAFQEHYARLTDEGRIVLTIGPVVPRHEQEGERKKAFDVLHLRKIDLADRVFVLNVGGYIGPSTRREIDYATAHGKPIDYLEPLAPPDGARDAREAGGR